MVGETWRREAGGLEWEVELERSDLLPGVLGVGTVGVRATHAVETRAIIAALIATERWQYDETTSDGQGHTHTRTVTRNEELRRVPVMLSGPTSLAPGEERSFGLQLPVPPLGPA